MKAIIIYCYIVIFGSWIYKLSHLPTSVGVILLQGLDYLPFLTLPFLFKVRRSSVILPNTIAFWSIIILFILCSLATTIIHNGRVMASVAHFGAMFRFTPLAALMYILKCSKNDDILFFRHFSIISFILILIGYIEVIGGEQVRDWFLPLTNRYSSVNVNNSTEIFGIFPNTVDYAYFLLLSYIIISGKSYQKRQFLLFIIYLIPIFYTGSKAVLLLFILCSSYKMDNIKTIRNTFITIVLLCALIIIYQFWDLFYWTVFVDSKASRLGYLISTLPNFIEEFSFDTFFGVSPDAQLVYNKINSYPDAPLMTWVIDNMPSFEDEFYVALPVYYGIIGFSLILLLFCGMYFAYNRAVWLDCSFNYLLIIKSLFTILLIAPLFNQIIILKPFSIFFWCWIGILDNKILKLSSEK